MLLTVLLIVLLIVLLTVLLTVLQAEFLQQISQLMVNCWPPGEGASCDRE